PITAAGIISEIGKIERFSSPAKLASYAGITWTSYESGEYKSENSHMTKKGNKYLRYYIIQAAVTVVRFEPVFKSYYDRKYNESFNHNAGRALVLSARKLVNVIYFMMINQKQYDPREIR
ncbi:MAG: transposase, partial [Thermotogae bacterium]|nr:transposase [Thermotogota bacterium]